VAFKSYFDGGNKADTTQHEILTLAAFSGSAIQWRHFEELWGTALARHHAPFLHLTDALSFQKPFTKENGWTPPKVEKFIGDCVGVVELCAANKTFAGIRPAAISVLLRDFKRRLSEFPRLGDVHHHCAVQCAGCCFNYGLYLNSDPLAQRTKFQFFFDRGEPFYGHIRDRVDHPRSRRISPLWPSVTALSEVDMRHTPAVQASDVLAWSINHNHTEGRCRFEWQKRMLEIERDGELFDYQRLKKPIKKNIEIVESLKLPKRKPMR
jgi:hypothetical protein